VREAGGLPDVLGYESLQGFPQEAPCSFQDVGGDEGTKRFLLYALRWQLSTPTLAIITFWLSDRYGFWISAAIANLVGAAIFFWVDRWIFKPKACIDVNTWEPNCIITVPEGHTIFIKAIKVDPESMRVEWFKMPTPEGDLIAKELSGGK